MQYRIDTRNPHIERKNNTFLLIKKIYLLLLLAFIPIFALQAQALNSQIAYTRSFSRALQNSGAEFLRPAENWLRIRPLLRDSFMLYDLVLHDDQDEFELRMQILGGNHSVTSFPHIDFTRLLSSISSNAEQDSLVIFYSNSEHFTEKYRAGWGVIADFTPKKSFSAKKYGRLISIHREESGLIHQVFLSDELLIKPEETQLFLRFRDEMPED